jgi:hypothetical protein
MTYKERVVHSGAASDHIVQLFDNLQSRASTIGAFTAEGLKAGDTVLIVAQPRNWKAMAEQITSLGCDVNGAIQLGQLTVLNAARTLKQFLVNGAPDQALYDTVVGGLIRSLLERGKPLRVYGEMVDILAGERDFTGAQKLEDFWNRLGHELSYTLFCGYSSANFAAQANAPALELVCRAHSEVRSNPVDELGSWLLTTNGSPAAGS